MDKKEIFAKKVEAWNCANCSAWHETEEDAIDCCPNEATVTDGWQCGECESTYETKEEADECCK